MDFDAKEVTFTVLSLVGSKITAAAGIYPHGLAKLFIDGIESQFVREYKTPQEVLMMEEDDGGVVEAADGRAVTSLWEESDTDEELVEDKQMKIPAGMKLL